MEEEKKKFTFRYDEELSKIFEVGFKLFRSECPTKEFSLNQLITIAVKRAIVIDPEEISTLRTKLNQVREEVDKEKESGRIALNQLDGLVSLLKQRQGVEDELNTFLSKRP